MDILHDNSRRVWLKIAAETDVPEYVLKAELLTEKTASEFKDSQFADVGKRMFPIDSPASTWLSAAYFAKHSSEVTPQIKRAYVESMLRHAGKIYGIEADVSAVLDKTPGTEKQAEDQDSNYGLIVRDNNGNIVARKYPMFDRNGVYKAASYFVRYRFKYPLELRHTIAKGIVKRANQLKAYPGDILMKEAGHGMPHRLSLMNEILERAKLTKDAHAAAVFAGLNEVIAKCSSNDLIKNAQELIATVDALDGLNNLRRYYNQRIMSPAETVLSMTEKQASAFAEDAFPLNKHVFSLSKLAELDPELFGVLGDDFVDELTTDGGLDREKLATILPTLPRPDKVLLEDHIVAQCSS